ncbi:MAG: DUF58 domain-containing protein, partial [Thermoplasmata archaeon]
MVRSRTEFTARGGGALFAAFLVFVVAFYSTNVLIFVVGVFLLGFVIAELLAFAIATRGFGPDSFTFERVECSSLVGVGGAGLVSLRATSHTPGSFYAEVYDTHPSPLTILEGSASLLTWWTAGDTLALAYVVSPELRGMLEIGPTVVMSHDDLGFAFKATRLDTPWTIEAIVRPSTSPLGHPARLDTTVVGQTSLSAPGEGSDFRRLREYQPNDELRRIAWTRSGQGTLYVREYDRESQQDLLVLLDVGRGMATGAGYGTAVETAVAAAAEVLRATFDEGGRGGLVVFDQRVTAFVPAGRGSSHEFRVFRELTGAKVGPTPSSLAEVLAFLRPRMDRPTTLIAFSSLTEDLAKLSAAGAGVRSAGHRLCAMVPDPGRMYDALPDPTEQTAFELLVEPERRRAQRAGDAIERGGGAAGFFGRDDAVATVA